MELVGKLSKQVSMQKLKENVIMWQTSSILLKKKVDYKSARYIKTWVFLTTFYRITFLFLFIFTHVHYRFFFFLNKLYLRIARWPGTENRTPLVAWTGFRIDTASTHRRIQRMWQRQGVCLLMYRVQKLKERNELPWTVWFQIYEAEIMMKERFLLGEKPGH